MSVLDSPVMISIVVCATAACYGQTEPDNTNALRAASRRAADTEFLLQYQMRPGEELRYEVEHLVKVTTEIQGNTQRTKSRSNSRKVWKVLEVDPTTGNITFTHEIDYVDMWNESQDREPTQYDSRTDAEPPPGFEQVAASVGKPIAKVTVDRSGRVVQREDTLKQHNLGTGGLLVPLPEAAVKIDAEWGVPGNVTVRLADGSYKTIKTRQVYRLKRVESGVATIETTTQVLTPAIDARMRSQLLQKMTHGEIRFDMDSGRVISRQLDWDEDVVGFNGPASNMSYLARHTEQLEADAKMARRP